MLINLSNPWPRIIRDRLIKLILQKIKLRPKGVKKYFLVHAEPLVFLPAQISEHLLEIIPTLQI
jgi:hypothetical protein